jgi:hypothetical protein
VDPDVSTCAKLIKHTEQHKMSVLRANRKKIYVNISAYLLICWVPLRSTQPTKNGIFILAKVLFKETGFLARVSARLKKIAFKVLE